MEIGNPQKTITISPLELPVPKRRETPASEPVAAPERENVLVPR